MTSQQGEGKVISLKEGFWNTFKLEPTYCDHPIEGEERRHQVKMALQYDEHCLTIKAEVNDAQIKYGERSWRYGDGFFINFVTP